MKHRSPASGHDDQYSDTALGFKLCAPAFSLASAPHTSPDHLLDDKIYSALRERHTYFILPLVEQWSRNVQTGLNRRSGVELALIRRQGQKPTSIVDIAHGST